MALYDNKHWLLSHIKNSFISSDDTGMCESVIIDEISKNSSLFGEFEKYPNVDESPDEDDTFDNSLDIHTDSEFGAHRLRANTAQRLAKIEQEMKIQRSIRHVKWETPINVLSDPNVAVFPRKEVKSTTTKKSLLSSLLENCPTLPRNPFVEFARFGGNAHVGIPTRTYQVFLTMLSQSERNFPISVCVLRTARVSELIGYVLWKYTTENTDPSFAFKENTESYGLYIAEDDGEVDWDFSCLDPKETVGKFGLAYLALVELPDKKQPGISNTEEGDGESDTVDSSKGAVQELDDWKEMKGDLRAIEALLYQSFPVQLLSKMRTRTDVVLGINGDKLEVDPMVTNTKVGGRMWKQKSASHNMDDIVFCDLIESKSSGRSVFRIVRRLAAPPDEPNSYPHYATTSSRMSSSFKHQDFEADHKTSDEIVKKINLILHLKCSLHRREYLTMRDKKLGRRRSFSLWPR